MRKIAVFVTALCCSVPTIPALAETRTYDGSGNNIANPTWGVAGTNLRRLTPSAYADGVSDPSGPSRPNPRLISNALFAQSGNMPNTYQLSGYVWQWGQFLDHDIDLTPTASPAEPLPITVPTGDPWFDPFNTGTQTLDFERSLHDNGSPRQQINQISSYIDASNVYGSDARRAAFLRSFTGGKLRISSHTTGDLLPFNDNSGTHENASLPFQSPDSLFISGDVRANEQVGLTAMHTLFMREHNRLAGEFAAANPGWNDEQLYQAARKVVGAQMQIITYNEFLPALLGPDAFDAYSSYDPNTNASIANEFSTAAFRLGHSMLQSTILRLDVNGNPITEGHLRLKDAFFNPARITDEGGVDPILRGLAATRQQQIDIRMVDDVRNFLFGPPGAGGLDLAALNIQRGRDHGLADFNTIRQELNLPEILTFADITSDPVILTGLQNTYASVNEIDAWVGMLAEDHIPGLTVGPTIHAILAAQFLALRDGDRFWYQNDPELANLYDLGLLENTRLSDIIMRNTQINVMRNNVFVMPIPEPASATILVALASAPLIRRRPHQSAA